MAKCVFARMEKGNYTERYQGYDGKRYHVNDTILLQDGPNRRYSLGVGYQLSHLQDATKAVMPQRYILGCCKDCQMV